MIAMKKILLAMGCAVSMVVFGAPIQERTVAKTFTGSEGGVFRYRLAEKAAPAGEKVPLVFFFHGAGERGTDNARQLVHGVTELVDWLEKHEKGYKLVAGQVPAGKLWVDVSWSAPAHTMPAKPSETMSLAMQLLEAMLKDPAVDADRVYVTGISMGGYGTWDVVSRRPDLFAAALPICGGGDSAQAPRLAKLPIWTFHGSADGAVPVNRSRAMVSALWAVGSNAHYREYPDMPHDVWTRTYRDPEVLKWFFSQKRRSAR